MDSHFFSNNRKKIIELLRDELCVVTAYERMQDTGDSAHTFKQEPNFWYLTGIQSPGWQLIIDAGQGKSWLIEPEVDAMHQLFDGSLSSASAKEISGVDEVLTSSDGKQLLKRLAHKYSTVHTLGVPPYAEYVDFMLNPAPENLRARLRSYFKNIVDCQKEFARLRAIKQPEEIAAIKEAINISIYAFEKIKKVIALDKYEYEFEAEMTYIFRSRNATHAFEPIFASGKNACTLHYVDNSSKAQQNELLLIDAGARLNYYSADITRTFSVSELTQRQAVVHLAVRSAEEQIISLIQPGVPLKGYMNSVDSIMKNTLLSLGLMKHEKDLDAYRKYFPHAVSHGLGLDVHEGFGGYKEFMPGMVLTVEPGVYIPKEKIGVRIEDNILVTEHGNENLTAALSTDR